MKFISYEVALYSLNRFSHYHFIYLGDHDDPRPYWVVDARTATKLEAAGYERVPRLK